MAHEDIGVVCSQCKTFNRAFIVHAPFTMLDVHQAAKTRDLPPECSECGAPLGSELEPESERQEVEARSSAIRSDRSRRWQP